MHVSLGDIKRIGLQSIGPYEFLISNCFLCVTSAVLKFGRGNKNITGMISSEKESFDFRTPVPIEGAVENWMTAVEAEMRRTLYQITKEGAFYYAKTPR